jgi:hypothetical protein
LFTIFFVIYACFAILTLLGLIPEDGKTRIHVSSFRNA